MVVTEQSTPVEGHAPIAVAASDAPASPAASASAGGAGLCLYLTGRPSLKDYLHLVRKQAVDPPDAGALTDEWNRAHRLVLDLERDEAGVADAPPLAALGPEYEPLLIELLRNALIRNGFNTLPTDIVLIDLDRTVVYQEHIDVTFTRDLEERLGPAPSASQVFRTCLPTNRPQPPVKWMRVSENRFVFVSPSNDLRFLGEMPLEPEQIQDVPPPGNLVGVIGAAVGFGSNFMNAIYAERRLILNNGSHRAYVLRKLGIRHVPCIVQHASSREELALVASSQVRRQPDLYLKHPRPPILRDYLDPRLHTLVEVERRVRQVSVQIKIDEHFVPAL
jgi:hypothetical protein